MKVEPKVMLIEHTPEPDKVVAAAARLCYSSDDIQSIMENFTQEKIDKFVNMLSDMGHCYDPATEVLTKRGFIEWSQVIESDELAVIDPETREFIGFEKPSRLTKKDYDGEMIWFNTNDIQLMVTNGHKLYCSLSNSELKRVNPQFELLETNKIIEDKSGQKYVYEKPLRMAKAAINKNESVSDKDLMYALYGFFIGDGHSIAGNQLHFHLKLTRKIKYLESLCDKLNLVLKENRNDKYVVCSKNIGKEFRKLFYNETKDKTFPDDFYTMSQNQFSYFLEGLLNSDGSKKRNTYTYSSTSKELIDKIQTLCALNDTVVSTNLVDLEDENLSKVYTINIASRRIMPYLNDSRNDDTKAEVVKYKGPVYCATVSTGLLMIRRINKIVLCGNCSPFEHVSFTFGIEGVSRALTHQLVRHRLASYSQKSQRYVTEGQFSYVIPPSVEENGATDAYVKTMEDIQEAYDSMLNLLIKNKCEQYMLDNNIEIVVSEHREDPVGFFKANFKKEYSKFEKQAAEDARFVLPNACETKIIVTMNARSLWNFFAHRCCNRAQWEIRYIAKQMLLQCKDIAPTLFKNAGAHCVSGVCPENNMQCDQLKGKIPQMNEVKELIQKYYNKD